MATGFIAWLESRDNVRSGGGWALVGVHHGEPVTLRPDQMARVLDAFSRNPTVWHEGEWPEPVVEQFASEHLPKATMRSWEPEIPKMPSLAIDLFGGTPESLERQVRSNPSFDPQASLAENLAKTQADWRGGPTATQMDIERLLAAAGLSGLASSGIDGLPELHRRGFRMMWTEKGNALSRLAEEANRQRQASIRSLLPQGGVFFAGADHLPEV